jgi:hypothetical protein
MDMKVVQLLFFDTFRWVLETNGNRNVYLKKNSMTVGIYIQTPSKNATTSGKHTHAWHLLLVNHVLLVICICSFLCSCFNQD